MTKDSIRIWDEIHNSRQWGTCPEPIVARWAMRRWKGQLSQNAGPVPCLLEIGCGVGPHAAWLGENGFIVDAFDSSPNAIARAKAMQALHRSSTNVIFYVDTMPFDPVEMNKYDGVYDVCSIQHVDDIEGCVKAAHSVLKPGGHMLSIIATNMHSANMDGELAGATFHRLRIHEVRQLFEPVFSKVTIDTMSRTDHEIGDDEMVCHWIVQATK